MISNLSMPIHELLDLIPSPCVVFDLAPFSWPEGVPLLSASGAKVERSCDLLTYTKTSRRIFRS